MFKIIKAKIVEDYRIFLIFDDGTEGCVDLSHLVGEGVFSCWQDYHVFCRFAIGEFGELTWGGGIELCPDALYLQATGKQPEDVFTNLQNVVENA